MKSRSFGVLPVVFAVLAGGFLPVALTAQVRGQDDNQPPVHPEYGGVNVRVRGVFVTPVAGSPLTATVLIESKVPLPDGTVETKRTINQIARDSQGRIHNERRRLEPESFHGIPPLLETHIFDPATRLNTFYDPSSRVAKQSVLPAPMQDLVARKISPNPNLQEEDLGTTTLNGVTVKGSRQTRTVPATSSGTGKPVEVVDEYWYSEELKLNLLVQHSDPRTGEQSVAISDLKRVEPAGSLFEVPAGYKVVDVTPPARN